MRAVDFLENAIGEAALMKEIYGIEISKEFIPNIIKQAKEIEKEQIIDAYKNGKYESDLVVMSDEFYAEQYYNETFKK